MRRLEWGLKASFLEYVRGNGTITATHGAKIVGNALIFPVSDTGEAATPQYNGRGTVRFRAHEGALDIPLTDPQLHVRGTHAELHIADPEHPGQHIRLARIERWIEHEDGSASGEHVTLALPGADLFFFGPYGPGTALDAIRLTAHP